MKPKHVYLELYRMNYYFYLGWKRERFAKEASQKFGVDMTLGEHEAGHTTLLQVTGQDTVVIWTENKHDFPVLVHECLHAANMTLDEIGVVPSFKNDEAQAYLVAFLVEKGME